MIEEGPRYHRAAEASAHIVNLLSGDHPGGKADLFSRVLFAVLQAMDAAERDLDARRREPSSN
jgi:hypothetical protein